MSREIIKNCLYRFCVIYIGSFVVCLRVYAYVPLYECMLLPILFYKLFSRGVNLQVFGTNRIAKTTAMATVPCKQAVYL